jgi:hypothetical protein
MTAVTTDIAAAAALLTKTARRLAISRAATYVPSAP